MAINITLTIDDVIDALANFLDEFVDGALIVRAQENRVTFPNTPVIVLTELNTVDLEVPSVTVNSTGLQTTIAAPKRIEVQIDFYSHNAGDLCNTVKGMFRTGYAVNKFPVGIQPLYASDGIQAPLINAEQQWESRWMMNVTLQYNPQTILTTQSANTASINILQAVDL